MEPAIQSSVTPCRLVAGLTARTIERTVGVVAIVTGIALGVPLILSCIIRAAMIFDGARDSAGHVSTLSVVADLARSAVGGVGYVLMIAVGVRLVHQRESVRRLLGVWAAVAIGAVLLGGVVGAIEEARTLAAGSSGSPG